MGKYKDPVRIDGKVVKNSEWVKEPDVEVIGADCNHNVDSQPDYTPSAPPEELVTGLYPSLEGLEEELNRDDAPETQEGTAVSPFHEGMDCKTVICNFFGHFKNCNDPGVKGIQEINSETWKRMTESFSHCVLCRPDYTLCHHCCTLLTDLLAEIATENTPSKEVPPLQLQESEKENDAPETQENSETPSVNGDGEIIEEEKREEAFKDLLRECANTNVEGKSPRHEGIDCGTSLFRFLDHFERQECGQEVPGTIAEMVRSYNRCAQCLPTYKRCKNCLANFRAFAGGVLPGDSEEEESDEEESPQPPAIFCVSCLLPGHQGGRECKWPQYKCQNCGHEHAWKIPCMEVEFTLKYGGNPLNLAPRKKTEDTSMEELCSDCLDLRHHSRMPCEKKEPP